eukprot:128448_1
MRSFMKCLLLFRSTIVMGYFTDSTRRNWEDSRTWCEQQGTQLASIHSESDWDSLQQLCKPLDDSCWVGMHDPNGSGRWEYVDGSITDFGFYNNDPTNPTTSVIPWGPDEPQDTGVLCIQYWNDYEECFCLDDTLCKYRLYAICNDMPTNPPSKYQTSTTASPSIHPTDHDGTKLPSISPTQLATLIPTDQPSSMQRTNDTLMATESMEIIGVLSTTTSGATINTKQTAFAWFIVILILATLILVCICYWIKKNGQKTKLKSIIETARRMPQCVVSDQVEVETQDKGIGEDEFEVIGDDDLNGHTGGEVIEVVRNNTNAREVQFWLQHVVKLPIYYEVFMKHGYESLSIIKGISSVTDLIEIGITLNRDQNKLLQEIQELEHYRINSVGSVDGVLMTQEGK